MATLINKVINYYSISYLLGMRHYMKIKAFLLHHGKTRKTEIPAIDFILKHPKLFGLTDEKIHSSFNQHSEMYGEPGQTIMDMLGDLTAQGWIIIEQKEDDISWVILIHSIEETKDELIKFIANSYKAGDLNLDDGVKVCSFNGSFQYEMEKGGIAGLFTYLCSDGELIMKLNKKGKPCLYQKTKRIQEAGTS
jgi:hypothetical protein